MINLALSLFDHYLFPLLKKTIGIKLIFQSLTKFRNETIRVSISYLYKIEIDNKYLLVKGKRIPNQFQPVGGVYKYYPSQCRTLFNSMSVLKDDSFNLGDDLKDDLRIKLKGKHLIKFISWFIKGTEREIDFRREFIEELLNTEILSPRAAFENMRVEFIKREILPIEKSEKLGCYEVLIRDIVHFIPTEEQECILKGTMNNNSTDYRWFNPIEISQLGRTLEKEELTIGKHAKSLIE